MKLFLSFILILSLVCCAKEGTKKQMEKIINTSVDVNTGNEKLLSPLFIAVLNNNNEVIPALISAGANVNAQDGDGRTALMYSVYFNKDIEQTRLLIEAGADINKTNIRTRNALLFARVAYESNEEVINYLIQAGADTSIEDPIPNAYRENGRNYSYYVYVTEYFYYPDH